MAVSNKALPFVGMFGLVCLRGPEVVQIADQAVAVEGIRIALEQFLGVLLHLVHLLLLALGVGQVDFRQLDHGVPVIRLVGGNQLHRVAQRVNRAGDIAHLQATSASL